MLYYSNRISSEIVYQDIFEQAEKDLAIKTVYTLTDLQQVPQNWQGKRGYIDEKMILKEVTDFKERIFYLSGPHSLVTTFEGVLQKMEIPKNQIKTDYFSGY